MFLWHQFNLLSDLRYEEYQWLSRSLLTDSLVFLSSVQVAMCLLDMMRRQQADTEVFRFWMPILDPSGPPWPAADARAHPGPSALSPSMPPLVAT